ncbi:MAG TPA: hypothetical protein VJP81_00935 [Candidatus Dormibacteraeota bacterium]|nr:hypothetical protein [Candidatus Dormibacteraeota bacterium]
MIRATAAAAVASLLLAPSVAAAPPSPSPSLDTVLAEPLASDFVPESRFVMALQGDFDAVDFLAVLNSSKPSHTLANLKDDGFVAGYGRSWSGNRTNHLLLEAVVAFSGGAGAKKWVPEARSLDQNGSYFKGNFSISGIDLQYGDHFANPAGPAYADSAGFVKGNDFFLVYMYSQKDDLSDFVARQARQLYDLAPASTIPPSKWPENAAVSSTPTSLPSFVPNAVLLALAAVVVVLFVVLLGVLVLRRGRPGLAPAPAVPVGIQMSSDGFYWWDGQSWRDASQSAPPAAQRSADGNYWWDGGKWRSMPRPPESPPGPHQQPEPPPPAAEPTQPAN